MYANIPEKKQQCHLKQMSKWVEVIHLHIDLFSSLYNWIAPHYDVGFHDAPKYTNECITETKDKKKKKKHAHIANECDVNCDVRCYTIETAKTFDLFNSWLNNSKSAHLIDLCCNIVFILHVCNGYKRVHGYL